MRRVRVVEPTPRQGWCTSTRAPTGRRTVTLPVPKVQLVASPLSLADPAPGVAGPHPWGRIDSRTDELLRAPDLLVVGAGLAGLAVAATAVAAGVGTVQVVDRGPVAGGATSRNAGALIPDVHALSVGPDEAALGRRGLALHREFARQSGRALRPLSWLAVTSTRPPEKRLTASGATWLADPEAIADATSGHVRAPSGVLVPDQAAIDPVAVAAALARQVPHVTTGVDVAGLDLQAPLRITTSAGEITPGAVVLATGAAPSAWLPTGRRFVTGHLAMTASVDMPDDLAVGGGVVVVPRGDGRLLVGGTRDGQQLDGEVDAAVVARIRQDLADLVPTAADVAFDQVWTGQRPVVDDDLPVIDEASPCALVVAGLYHTGVLTCLAVAEGVVDRLQRGTWPSWVEPFHRRS